MQQIGVVRLVSKPAVQTLMKIMSFMLATPLAAVMMVHPSLMLDEQGHYSHPMLMLVMLGISAGFIHGVGFVPRFWLWRLLFSPYIGWPLMMIGYWTWLVK